MLDVIVCLGHLWRLFYDVNWVYHHICLWGTSGSSLNIFCVVNCVPCFFCDWGLGVINVRTAKQGNFYPPLLPDFASNILPLVWDL